MKSTTDVDWALLRENQPGPEAHMLKALQKKSGLTVAEIAAATGISVATLQIAFNGIRYRSDGPRTARPTDATLVKLGLLLGVSPESLRSLGRDRAAELLEAAAANGEASPAAPDREAVAAASARAALASQVLGAFSTEELKAEIRRRKQSA